MSKYINFGDVNYMDYEGLWIKQDEADSNCYYFVKINNLTDSCGEYGYLLEEGSVNLTDDWIKWDEVYSSYDIDNTAENEEKVICLIGYYSVLEFGTSQKVDTKLEALEFLESYGIELDQTSTEYKKEVETDVFLLINDMVIAIGTNAAFLSDEVTEEAEHARKLEKELLEEEMNQQELCEKYHHELSNIREYLSNHYEINLY